MKILKKITISLLIICFGLPIHADEIIISIEDTNILQEQNSFDSEQELLVGSVSEGYQGDVSIFIKHSNIIQIQNSNQASQKLKVGNVVFNSLSSQ